MRPSNAVLRARSPVADVRLLSLPGAGGAQPRRVREATGSDRFPYEPEGTERVARGAVTIGADAWWSAELTVADGAAGAEQPVLLRVRRHGDAPAGCDGLVEAALMLPPEEVAALVSLVAGVADQARRDGLLTNPRAD